MTSISDYENNRNRRFFYKSLTFGLLVTVQVGPRPCPADHIINWTGEQKSHGRRPNRGHRTKGDREGHFSPVFLYTRFYIALGSDLKRDDLSFFFWPHRISSRPCSMYNSFWSSGRARKICKTFCSPYPDSCLDW